MLMDMYQSYLTSNVGSTNSHKGPFFIVPLIDLLLHEEVNDYHDVKPRSLKQIHKHTPASTYRSRTNSQRKPLCAHLENRRVKSLFFSNKIHQTVKSSPKKMEKNNNKYTLNLCKHSYTCPASVFIT